MERHLLLRALVVAGLALAPTGCMTRSGEPSTPVTASAPGGPPAATGRAPSSEPAAEPLAATGVGPYAVGAKLATLRSTGVLANVNESTGCTGWATADATGPYADALSIVFYNGAIKWLEVKTSAISTVDGAKIGMTVNAIKSIYREKGTEFKDGLGGRALSVHDTGGLGLFFRAANGETVSLIEAGPYEALEFRYIEGEGC
jgi:hypothetical protein